VSAFSRKCCPFSARTGVRFLQDFAIKEAGLARDAKTYKPVRDAMAHTSVLTSIAKQSLNTTYENIKARIKRLLE
jgi:hypothetical protein